jgi:hypothetical protein
MRLFRQFVSREMIALFVGNRRGSVGVSCEVVKFGDAIVRTLWHIILIQIW